MVNKMILINQSTLTPTFPNFLIPPAHIKQLVTQAPKQVQKLALYPSHNVPITSTSPISDLSEAVTLAATMEVIARPTELPI